MRFSWDIHIKHQNYTYFSFFVEPNDSTLSQFNHDSFVGNNFKKERTLFYLKYDRY